MEREVVDEPESTPANPEEMKASFNLKFGEKVSLQATARATPAGIATVGITVAVIIGAVGLVVWANRKRS